MDNRIELELISTETHEVGSYDETVRTYKCPCGKGTVVWSKERPNGSGYGYQATFSDAFCRCEDCKDLYDVEKWKGYAIPL
ncbi:hypothetical protein [Streptococcus suis]|uniref:hypothetical protein n=1 Tax=Streptococcus suis TaxID=1307 RepID=UPI0004A2291C|nr:hypothetical protein [Streptococcus suis]HEM5315032.1 hypothetical protein [Streptococcus suis]